MLSKYPLQQAVHEIHCLQEKINLWDQLSGNYILIN